MDSVCSFNSQYLVTTITLISSTPSFHLIPSNPCINITQVQRFKRPRHPSMPQFENSSNSNQNTDSTSLHQRHERLYLSQAGNLSPLNVLLSRCPFNCASGDSSGQFQRWRWWADKQETPTVMLTWRDLMHVRLHAASSTARINLRRGVALPKSFFLHLSPLPRLDPLRTSFVRPFRLFRPQIRLPTLFLPFLRPFLPHLPPPFFLLSSVSSFLTSSPPSHAS